LRLVDHYLLFCLKLIIIIVICCLLDSEVYLISVLINRFIYWWYGVLSLHMLFLLKLVAFMILLQASLLKLLTFKWS